MVDPGIDGMTVSVELVGNGVEKYPPVIGQIVQRVQDT